MLFRSIDLTWWMTWYDLGVKQWVSQHTTKSLFSWGNNDYTTFYNSLNGEGFSLLLNLAEGGVWPGFYNVNDCMKDGKPHYMVVSSVKVYSF